MKHLCRICAGLAFVMLAWHTAAAPFTERNERTGWTTVTTDYYQCTIFPGSMFPVWFNSPDGKTMYPRHFMLDWIKVEAESDLMIHYLRHECYAEVKILEEDDAHVVFECIGRFCMNQKMFPNVTARYRYTIRRDSPEILLEAELTADDPSKAKDYLVNCGALAWERKPFTDVKLDGKELQSFYPGGAGDGQPLISDTGLDLLVNGLAIGISGPCVAWNNAAGRYFTYLSRTQKLEERRWNGKAPYRFSVKYRVDGRNAR